LYTTYCYYRELWEATNNTVGFNHMVASGPDAENYTEGETVALAMETMYGYTAYFADNDERSLTNHNSQLLTVLCTGKQMHCTPIIPTETILDSL